MIIWSIPFFHSMRTTDMSKYIFNLIYFLRSIIKFLSSFRIQRTSDIFQWNSSSNYLVYVWTEITEHIDSWTHWWIFDRPHKKTKLLYTDSDWLEVCSQGSNCQWISFGQRNGLVLVRHQTSTWNNNHLVNQRIYEAPGLDESARSPIWTSRLICGLPPFYRTCIYSQRRW